MNLSQEPWQTIEAGLPYAEKVRRTRQWIELCLAHPPGPTMATALVAARKQLELLIESCESALGQGASWDDLASTLGLSEQGLRALLTT